MTQIEFTKMHGLGNDYLLVNCPDAVPAEWGDVPSLARRMSDRHLGAGSDGLILLLPPEPGMMADLRMRMFNADGSEAEMCGNGIRCLCKLAHDDGICRRRPMRIQTAAGILSLDYRLNVGGEVEEVTVDMGRPILKLAEVPVVESALSGSNHPHRWRFSTSDSAWTGVFVSMGNPHVVLLDEENPERMECGLDRLEVPRWGSEIEVHPAFPHRINAHWAAVRSCGELAMRTWERGAGETRACGTGAAAVCVAAALTERAGRDVLIRLPGGDLRAYWDPRSDCVFITGPAVEVFRGRWRI